MDTIETLINACVESGFFKTKEDAKRYVMLNCIANKLPEERYDEIEVFSNTSSSDIN